VAGPAPRGVQGSFDELGAPLRDVVFVVVDLETTGTSPDGDAITEIGAVKVRAGEVLGEFQTLVRPSGAIPPFIQVLTGITDAMVADAPRIEAALPAFLEFARGAVLVAHNAPFDVGFLKAAAARHGIDWPRPGVVDTARLARRVLTRDEAPNCRLATLARLFRATTQPVHRALADARATVDVLHGLLERVGNEGVHSLDELETYSSRVSPAVRRKRHLAEGLPSAPGVYLFLDADGRVLYIGTSRDLRSRVRSYFTASESRTRMAEMVRLAERVQVVPCATALEAEVRELRLIAEHKPRYNRRSRFPERSMWVALTAEPFPRLSVVREVRDDGGAYLGPFGSRRSALDAVAALHEALPLRQCTPRLPAAPGPRSARRACALYGMGRCGAPCEGLEDVATYAAHVEAARAGITADARGVQRSLEDRIAKLAAEERYEEAAEHRDRLAAWGRAAARGQRLAALARLAELVAARRDGAGWEIAVVRHGRLAAAGASPAGADLRPYVDALRLTAEVVRAAPPPLPAAIPEEAERVLRWLDAEGVRLVHVEAGDGGPDGWCEPAFGAGSLRPRLEAATTSAMGGERERRRLRPTR
jgi:DNA polymerase-3 subunit epsilon